jgi:glycosyltransferase involved in cell wall biosynthesis
MKTDVQKGMVSIIIPVYNSKQCLRECLESVVLQSYANKEVIVVDDCSTDGSLELCREFEQKYPFFHVYTKENEGVSAARNFGLQMAQGEYIEFADSDDRLYPDACEKLVEEIQKENGDLVIGGYFNEKEQKDTVYQKCVFEDKGSFLKAFPKLFSGFFLHVPWNKLYRREAIDRAEAVFPQDLEKGEDLLFNLRVFEKAEKISVIDDVLYFYHNVNENSLSFRFRTDAMEIEERLYREVLRFYQNNGGGAEISFLHRYYLTAVKNKYYALIGKSGFNKEKCRKIMEEWGQRESFRDLYESADEFGRKDRILLFLMKHRQTALLYRYYHWRSRPSQ